MPTNSNMVEVAKAYCDVIEEATGNDPKPRWLEEVAALLPKLNLAVATLEADDTDVWVTPDFDARFDLFARLHELLGELDSYWLEFDSLADDSTKTGSLADDLTDIYCELKSGLELLDGGTKEARDGGEKGTHLAMAGWRAGYRKHWARHLLDAQRHLNDLELQR